MWAFVLMVVVVVVVATGGVVGQSGECNGGYFCGIGSAGSDGIGRIYYDDQVEVGGTSVGVVVVDAFGVPTSYTHGSTNPVLNTTTSSGQPSRWLNLSSSTVYVFSGPGGGPGDTTTRSNGGAAVGGASSCDCHSEKIYWRSMTLPLEST